MCDTARAHLDRAAARRWRCAMRRSWWAGSKISRIRPPLLQRRNTDRFVESSRLGPDSGSGRSDPVSPLGHALVANHDLSVVAVDQAVAFEPCHHLIERRGTAADAIRGKGVAHD